MTLSMKIFGLFLTTALLCVPLSAGDTAPLSPRFRTVYILEMANGLDQHMASRLTSSRVMWVVLEPSSADSVLTESVDDAFWTWLARTYPAAPGARPAPDTRASAPKPEATTQVRHPGTVFLVDPRARVILWSAWEEPWKKSPGELDRTAGRFTNLLKIAFEKK
jgi:hypothetical protein